MGNDSKWVEIGSYPAAHSGDDDAFARIAELEAEVARLQAEIARLQTAMAPIAHMELWGEPNDDDVVLVSIGTVRRVRDALNTTKDGDR